MSLFDGSRGKRKSRNKYAPVEQQPKAELSSMNVKICAKCRRLFQAANKQVTLCPECVRESEKQLRGARKYIRSHPGCTVEEIMEMTGADRKMMLQLLREGQLEDINVDSLSVPCAKCGAPLFSEAKYCEVCSQELIGAFSDVAKNIKEKSEAEKQPHARRRSRERW